MKECPKCHAQIEEDADFCTNCGINQVPINSMNKEEVIKDYKDETVETKIVIVPKEKHTVYYIVLGISAFLNIVSFILIFNLSSLAYIFFPLTIVLYIITQIIITYGRIHNIYNNVTELVNKIYIGCSIVVVVFFIISFIFASIACYDFGNTVDNCLSTLKGCE